MHRGLRRARPLVALLVVMVTACTVTRAGECPAVPVAAGDANTSTATPAGVAAVGVTDDSITLSMLVADLSLLTKQGLAPDIGDPKVVADAVVADINAKGGINGRKLVLKTHVLDGLAAIMNPASAQASCISATEQDHPLAVIMGASLPSDLIRCTAVTHPVLTMAMNSYDDVLYRDAEHRLFSCCSNLSTGTNRVYSVWPKMLVDAKGMKKGARVGIISQQPGGIATDQRDAIAHGLEPALKQQGVTLAASAELPCPEGSQTCSQQAAAIQKMKDAKVQVVFLTAGELAGEATVAAADALDYHPVWTTVGDNVTDTVANFYVPVKDSWDGAYGVSTLFEPPSSDAAACNAIASKAGVKFAPGTDGYGFAAVTCLQVRVLAKAIEGITGTITQQKVIDALQAMTTVPTNAGPEGTFGPDKHDAGNSVFMARYSAAAGRFVPVGGKITPVKVP